VAHEPSQVGHDRLAQVILRNTRTGDPMDLNLPRISRTATYGTV
jgi:hypothetical protein